MVNGLIFRAFHGIANTLSGETCGRKGMCVRWFEAYRSQMRISNCHVGESELNQKDNVGLRAVVSGLLVD